MIFKKIIGSDYILKIMNFFIKCVGTKRKYEKKYIYEKTILKKQKEKKYILPKILIKSKISKEKINNFDVYHFFNTSKNNNAIIYLHGGAYINNPNIFHIMYIDKIVKKTNIDVYLPIYPLAPNHNCEEAYDFLLKLYKKLINEEKNIIIMGDSAGGGLALGFTIYLNELMIKQPIKIILISPWVDVTMSNSDIKKYEKNDPMLSSYGLIEIGKIWKGNLDIKDYRVSPIYNEFKNIPLSLIIVGTNEILYPDIIMLYKKIVKNNNSKLIIGKNLNHIFPLYHIGKIRKYFNEIIEFIKK